MEKVDDSRFKLYDLPTPLTGPCDLVEGHDGALWGEGVLNNVIFRMHPHTGAFEEYPIPFTTPLDDHPIELPGLFKSFTDRTAFSCVIRRGADGNLYAANGMRNQLLRINEKTKKIDVFQITPTDPLDNLVFLNDIDTAEDDIYVTSTTANPFSFFSFATEKFESYYVLTPLSLPLGVLVASDGLVYIVEFNVNKKS
ncbi:uncharacterized protein RCC_08349 [Ramularia collo-cygni]|uniref:SMP-30/Gluconolactonase/LRE-like region domain-containing protein n=1 Tax=Ramularia collo-cygni TaxID=112498 RepID=A0A2D3VK20_9PEZI|nr:uncharacterized protein RCC_08349 [Ramularia collo-cygni]CZT22644.1 uncharacterized protein RCC_08349 [Ramularia collo-cygni]